MSGGRTVVAFLACAVAACRGPVPRRPPAVAAPSEQVARIDAALGRLEQRLLASQANVTLWDELRTRHEQVSAIACRNLGEHARAVALFDEHRRDRSGALKRNRIATRLDPSAAARR